MEGWHFLNMLRILSYTDCQGKSVGWIQPVLQRDLMSPLGLYITRNTAWGYFSARGGHSMFHHWMFMSWKYWCIFNEKGHCVCVQACEKDSQCGGGMCCAISLWIRSLRMCVPMGQEGEECHPMSHKVNFLTFYLFNSMDQPTGHKSIPLMFRCISITLTIICGIMWKLSF